MVAVLVLTLALVLLFVLRWRHEDFDWRLFSATLLKMRWDWLILAAALGIATYHARALRWAVMLRPMRPNPSIWGLFSATAIGFTAIVLFGRPGELVRPYLISSKEKVPFSSQVAAWLIERIFDLLSALLIFGFAMTQVAESSLKPDSVLSWVLKTGGYVAAVAAGAAVALLLMFRQTSDRVKRRLVDALGFLPSKLQQRVHKLLDSFVLGVECVRSSRSALLLVGYTALEWGLITLCFAACFRAFPALAGFTLTNVLVVVGFVAMGSLIHIPGIGGGAQLMMVVVLTEIFHQPLEIASGMAIVNYFITFIVIVPFGLVLLVHEGLNFKKIREMEERELE